MSRTLTALVVFAVGLLAVCWIGAGYVTTNPLAFFITAVIAACYVAGAWELLRFRNATLQLQRVLSRLDQAPADLGAWVGQLPVSLRNAVRLRVQGERVALPGPSMAGYLVGLLVLLGMLGTLLGMMVTLRGTGLALESASDLDAIRASLAAPVKGLAFAFGTSIVGVTCSAMLGLLSAIFRRERVDVVQQLDAAIAGTLAAFSHQHERQETVRLLREQNALMPTVVEQLQQLVARIEQQQNATNENLLNSQQAFLSRSETAYQQLGQNLQQALAASVSDSALTVAKTLQPLMDAGMQGLTAHAADMQQTLAQNLRTHLDSVHSQLQANSDTIAHSWRTALDAQQSAQHALVTQLEGGLQQFTAHSTQQGTALVDTLATRLEQATQLQGQQWQELIAQQQAAHALWQQQQQQATADQASALSSHVAALREQAEHALQQQLAAQQQHDTQRLQQWHETLQAVAEGLQAQWQHHHTTMAEQQTQICRTLEDTAREITAHSKAHATDTIAEISRLVATASEAPRAAADVVAELRQKLSDSMVRDTAMLEERGRLLETLETLLSAINHASTEQRVAVDALVTTSAQLLERVGARFAEQIDTQAQRLDAAAAQVTSGADEVSSFAEAFSAAMEQFAQSSEVLGARLQTIEVALDKSMARSDDQLAYYAGQAREVIELSLLSQKQIIAELQQLADGRSGAGAVA